MMHRNIFCFLAVALTLFSSYAWTHDELLKKGDIYKVMDQIFQQHVEQKKMTTSILKRAFQSYIDQFDPTRVYLLEPEVSPYLKFSNEGMEKILEQYMQNDLSAFMQLNATIKKSIERARQYRKNLEKNNVKLFQLSKTHDASLHEKGKESEYRRPFAKDDEELKTRIAHEIIKFIQEEEARFGGNAITDEAKILALYEKQAHTLEDEYLGTDAAGKPLSSVELENLFALHVLKALTHALDSHTTVLNNTEAYEMKLRLEKEFHGIGVRLKKKGDAVIIASITNDGPAAKSGQVQVNDRVIEINGHSTAKESFERIVEVLHDSSDPTVALVLKRNVQNNGRPIEQEIRVQLKRIVIALKEGRMESSYEKFDNGIIGKIVLHMFYQGEDGISSSNDVRNAIEDLKKKGNLRGLILDLRDNGGGFLNQAVKVAGLFITTGVIVVAKYSNGDEQIYRDTDASRVFDGPLVILTSRWTASAAEIVAQALQDYGVALIVGDEHTYGKGTIQTQTVTENGSSSFFKVTVGKYYTVSGKTPQLEGVKADIVAPSRYGEQRIGEAYLDRPIASDQITPLYSDDFSDISPRLREWYLRYYASNIQRKSQSWRNMLPALRKNSEERFARNKNYKTWLKVADSEEDAENESPQFEDDDLQMKEATAIVKDMILLQSGLKG